MVQVVAVTDTTVEVVRGILDTVPQDHSAGALILFGDGFEASDSTLYLPPEEVDVKIQTKTGKGYLDLGDATEHSATMAQRQYLPYAPGLFRINGDEYPDYIEGELVVTWAHRDRVQQTGGTFVDQYEASIGPEAATTYTVKVYNRAGTLLRTTTGITGTTWTYVKATEESVIISNRCPALARVLNDTAWGGGWRRPLLSLEGAVETGTQRFTSEIRGRAVAVPMKLVMEGWLA